MKRFSFVGPLVNRNTQMFKTIMKFSKLNSAFRKNSINQTSGHPVFNFSKAKHHTSHFSVSRLYRDIQMRIILLAMKISSMSIHDLPEE